MKLKLKLKIDTGNLLQLSLGRLFMALAAIALLALIGTTGGLYIIATQEIEAESAWGLHVAAETTAKQLAHSVAVSGDTLERQAQDPEYGRILGGGDPSRILAAEERLTRIVPESLLVRLLPDTIEVPDEQRAPHMGFADLEAVRKAASEPVPATMHAANTPDAHIAVVMPLAGGGGVLLASLSPKLATATLPKLERGALELKQQNLSLAFQGDASLKQSPPGGSVPVPGTPWTLAYWGAPSEGAGGPWFLGYAGLATLLVVVGAYLIQRWAGNALRHDQDNIGLMARDLCNAKGPRRYPLRLKESQRLALQLERLRTLPPGAAPPTAQAAPTAQPTDGQDNPFLPTIAEPELLTAPPGAEEATTAPAHIAVDPGIFRAHDIMGIVGQTLSPETMQLLGRAIGSEARDRGEYTLAIARDGRISSLELSQALGRGISASGCSVIDLGMVPTPVLYFATHVLNSASGVMITGGYAPPEWNGLKIVLGGERLILEDLQKLRGRIERNDFQTGAGQTEALNIVGDYMERIVHNTQLGREMKVVVDCGNGVTGNLAPPLLKEIGCEVLALYTEVDGNFPNHSPNPSQSENLATLVRAVRQEQADLGLAFDGEGVRLGVVDSSGRIIWPDRQMMLFAADALSREPGSDIIFDVQCTRHLASHIVRNGGRPLMWKVGSALMQAKLKQSGGLLAGDLNGHIFFRERWYGFEDGLYACARLIEILSSDPRPTAEVFAELPENVKLPELRIALPEGEKLPFIEALRSLAEFPEARVTDIDGLRIDFADGWGLVRATHNSPDLALRFEADNPDALMRIQGEFKALMQKVKPKISFPLSLSERPDIQ